MISREEVNLILILQGYDTRLIFLTERLESLPGDRAKIEGTMAKEKKKLSDLKAKSSGVEMEFSRVNFDLELLGQKLIELKIKQSSIKNSKKYDLAQSQIAALEEKIEQLENDSIRLLYSLDDLKIEQDRVVDEVNLCLDNLNGELAQNRSLQGDVEKNISELKLKIDTMRKTLVNKNLLKMYDLARQGVRMPVVAIVDGGRCKGCNIRISNDTLAALSHAETFGQCEACGRLLYAEEQEEFFDDEND